MKTATLTEDYKSIQNGHLEISMISENIWKNVPGIQALFFVSSSGKTLFSKYSKNFNNIDLELITPIISSACSSYSLASTQNPLNLSINVFEKFTAMTSQMGESFLVMIVPNNTSVGNSIQFTESLNSLK